MSLVVQGVGGTITVSDAVLADIATRASESVAGVRVRRRCSVDLEAGTVTLGLAAPRGEPLTSIGEQVQEQVAAAFRTMCELEATVDVRIDEVG